MTFFIFKDMQLLQNALAEGLTPAIVVTIYLVVVKILDNKKEQNQAKLNAEFTKSITTIGNFLEKVTHTIVEKDKEKCRIDRKSVV